MELCVGVEYLKFCATCKQCHLAAPTVQWSKGGRLQAHSLVSSPWLMVLDKYLGIISFIDPMFGDKYFLKTPIGNVEEIHCSMYGWLLIRKHNGNLMFYNPFSSDISELPQVPNLDSYCFSTPPTSSDCMVVGFTPHGEWHVYIHYVAREPSWRSFHLNFCGDVLHSFHFATLCGGSNLYALYNNGGLEFIDTDNNGWRKVEGPRSTCGGSLKQNFLMKCDQQLLLVIMSEFGESIEVFKLNGSTEWEKIESLGRHVIYIGGKACLCIEAKTLGKQDLFSSRAF
ncbi:hypothetical protein HanIR_Chr10g0452691 [Helianthus annuus]|nr:hypothetical protein HanIR_Chr10g0452691 [Helianthus annuus]